MAFYMKGMQKQDFDSESYLEYRIELDGQMTGKFANWLLRSNKNFRFFVTDETHYLLFYLKSESEKQELFEKLNTLQN